MGPPSDDSEASARAVPRRVATPWRAGVVLVCRECDGAKGFGPKRVRAAFRAEVKSALPRRTVRVLAVECLDVCPKGAVTVATLGLSEATVVVRRAAECATVVDGLAAAHAADR